MLSILLILGINSYSQTFVTINPMQGHMNLGVLVNASLDEKVGVYGNLLYGDIIYKDFYTEQYKYGVGFNYKVSSDVTLLIGLSTSTFKNTHNYGHYIDMSKYHYNTVNIGFFTELPTVCQRKINILFLTDVVNWESQIGIGIKLKKY